MKRIILLNILCLLTLIIFFIVHTSSYSVVGVGACSCDSCTDCEDALNYSGCFNSIKLLNDMESLTGLCINGGDINDFENKIIYCDDNNITGINNYSAIQLYKNDNIIIQDCVLNGLSILFSDSLTIKNNIFYSGEYGINIFFSENSEIKHNIFNETYYGLRLQGLNNSIISNNEFYENNIYGVGLLEGNYNNLFSNNLILNTSLNGFNILGGHNNKFKFNKVCDSKDKDFYNVGDNIGEENICDISYNWNDNGVDDDCLYQCEYNDCDCFDCQDCTDKLNDAECKKVKLLNDIIFNNDICINGSDINNLQNKIFDCQNYKISSGNIGVYLDNNNFITIKNCHLSYFNYGISIHYSDNLFIENNRLNNNKYGVYINNSKNGIIQLSEINNNSINGIYAKQLNQYQIISNNMIDNENEGAKFHNSSWVEFIGNILLLNRGGVYMGGLTDNFALTNNIICKNKERSTTSFDIENFGGLNKGTKNVCDYTFQYNDNNVTGCVNDCANEYITIEAEINASLNDLDDMLGETDFIQLIIEGLENVGVRGSGSFIIFAIIFKIIIDTALVKKGLGWQQIIIINFIIIGVFYFMGWLPIWFVLIMLFLSIGIFSVIYRQQ